MATIFGSRSSRKQDDNQVLVYIKQLEDRIIKLEGIVNGLVNTKATPTVSEVKPTASKPGASK